MPGTLDLVGFDDATASGIYAGDVYDHVLTFTTDADTPEPLDLSAGSWRADLRRIRTGDVVGSFTVDTTDADTGVLVLQLTEDDSASIGAALLALVQSDRRYQHAVVDIDAVWDLQDATTGTTYLEGRAEVRLDVTR